MNTRNTKIAAAPNGKRYSHTIRPKSKTMLERYQAKTAKFPWYLAVIASNACFQGMIVNGFISTSISSLEKRFNMSSMKSGIFAATYDVATTFCLVPLVLLSKNNKNIFIGSGMLLLGISSFILILPHFLEGNYSAGSMASEHCDPTRKDECNAQTVSDWAYPLLILSQILCGIGASPLFTYGYSNIDEYDSHANTGTNMAIFMGVSTLGPAIGFIGGGALLNIWGDVGKSHYEDLGITGPDDPRWYGAWWIGFAIAGACCIVTAIPMLLFPKKLIDTDSRKKNDKHITHRDLNVDFSGERMEFLRIFWLFLRSPTCMALIFVQTFESLLMNGYITFVPKLLENLFAFTSGKASIITGAVVIPMGLIGNTIGAWLTKKFGSDFRKLMMILMAATIMTMGMSAVFLVPCESRTIAGIQGHEYLNSSIGQTCNGGCNCDRIFDPVCEVDTRTSFMSPCHAGCQRGLSSEWDNCSCTSSTGSSLKSGWCSITCTTIMYFFFAVFSGMAMTIFSGGPILQSAVLRIVSFNHRDAFLCFGWIFMRAIGSVPGAIIFGMIIDSTCLYWVTDCAGASKCLIYDSHRLSFNSFIFTFVSKFLVLTCIILAWWTYKPMAETPEPANNNTQTMPPPTIGDSSLDELTPREDSDDDVDYATQGRPVVVVTSPSGTRRI